MRRMGRKHEYIGLMAKPASTLEQISNNVDRNTTGNMKEG